MLLVILLLVTTYSWQTTTVATPVHGLPSPRIPTGILQTRNENSSFLFSRSESQSGPQTAPCSCPQLRSTWDILWSCLATIFACTWVAVHPNSPGVNPGKWRATLRRVELMIWSMLIPEMIIFWALRQWIGARMLARRCKDYGWTMTHAHFLQMGGFELSSQERDLEVLTPERFETLLEEGEIRFPNISAEEIKALGKGDGLSKTIVFVQALWFIAQCISRAAQKLVITEVELVTVAFCFLNGFMYFLWWDKPLDATFVVRLPRIDVDRLRRLEERKGVAALPMSFKQTDTWDGQFRPVDSVEDMNVNHELIGYNEPEMRAPESPPGHERRPRSIPREHDNNSGKGSARDKPNGSDMDESCCVREPPKGHVTGSISRTSENSVAGRPRQPTEPLESPSSAQDAHIDFSHVVKFIWRRMGKMQNAGCWADKMHPPIFGAQVGMTDRECRTHYYYHYVAVALVATIFGGIHCAGWRFAFPSHAEKILWRVAALIISVIPCVIPVYFLPIIYAVPEMTARRVLYTRRVGVGNRAIRVWLVVIRVLPIYLLARVILLVEALISLRNLPQGAYVQVEWLRFLPHI